MARKKWEAQTQLTPSLIKLREKKRWQIALRRYVLEKQLSISYAPYFGLDTKTIREWFESQFEKGISWENFGTQWQFEHIIPVVYFEFTDDDDLRLCWNFTNLRVDPIPINKNRGHRVDLLAAKSYFKRLHDETGYVPCFKLLEKIDKIELSELINSKRQFSFIRKYRDYLELLEGYSEFEFELLNRGRSAEEVNKQAAQLKKILGT